MRAQRIKKGETKQIVVAWTTTEIEVVQARRADLGEKPITREVKVGRACMWVREGAQADLEKARAWAAAQKDTQPIAMLFDAGTQNCLDLARAQVTKEKPC